MEVKLREELDTILRQEEMFWKQKSRITWLKEGEQNTRFFHTFILIRRRRNNIARIKIDGENWCEDQRLLKAKAREFYLQLYTAEPCGPCSVDDWNIPTLTHRDKIWLKRPVSALEVKDAIFQMGALKVPEPDGFPHASFINFGMYWEIKSLWRCS